MINKSRIKDARLMRGLTLKQAAEKLGRSVSWLSGIEQLEKEIPFSILQFMFRIYELPYRFFMRPDKEVPIRILPQVRKMRLSETIKRRTMIILRSYFEIIETLEKQIKEDKNEKNLPLWKGTEKTASEIRNLFNRDGAILESMSRLLEDAGILVKELDVEDNGRTEGSDKVFESMTIQIKDRYIVGISARLPAIKQREAMAKELAIIIGDKSGIEISKTELRSFICHLLIDPGVLDNYYDKSGYLDAGSLKIMSYIFGISKRYILEYLVEKGKLGNSGLRYWLNRMKTEGWDNPADYRKCFRDNYYRRLLTRAAVEPSISRDSLSEINSMY